MTRCLYLVGLLLVLNFLNINAQIDYEQVRSADTTSYYVNNPFGDKAEFTWTISGGIIAGHSSPYTADGADTIRVIWNDSNKTSANYGFLTVSEIIHWQSPSSASCQSNDEQIYVQSWVQPKAATDTSAIIVCSGEEFLINLNFQGKPGYRYKWKLYDKDTPSVIIEDHTTDFINCDSTSTDIIVPGIVNTGNTEKSYEFEVTDVQDTLNDGMPGNVSMGRVTVRVQPVPKAGIIKSSNQLIRR